MARRNSAADFQRDVGARTGVVVGHVWAAVLNADNQTYAIKLTSNGVTTTLYPSVFWAGSQMPSSGLADANPSGDRVIIYSADGSQSSADTSLFLLTLN
jgi:hypothetical protein